MSTPFTIHTPINDFIAEDVRRTGVFEELNIDSCCGGHRTLAEACAEKGIDPEAVLNRLMTDSPETIPSPQWWRAWTVRSRKRWTISLQTHHTYLKEALPRLAALLDKVVNAHVARHPELTTVRELFGELRADLEPHLMKEEQVLFPMIKQIESSGGTAELALRDLAKSDPRHAGGTRTGVNPVRKNPRNDPELCDAGRRVRKLPPPVDRPG